MVSDQVYYDTLFKDHKLQTLAVTEEARVYRLARASGGSAYSTLLVFTREGTTIRGDTTPGGRGVFSLPGNGFSWFLGDHDSAYLCGKFLVKEWQSDIARAQCKQLVEDLQERLDVEDLSLSDYEEYKRQVNGLTIIMELMDSGLIQTATDFCSWWDAEVGGDGERAPSGLGYDPHDAALLSAIHKTFCRLWHFQLGPGSL